MYWREIQRKVFDMQRTRRSFINVMTTVVTNFIILFTAFAVQRVLVHTMGGDYNGLNGLFSSIISMMSLADLGIGTAIIYHMYRPVAEDDHERMERYPRKRIFHQHARIFAASLYAIFLLKEQS